MFQSVQSKLRAVDLYRKLPSELTEPTLSGALISIISTSIIILLIISEFASFMSTRETSEMFVDITRGD
jgi:hypothetical protein